MSGQMNNNLLESDIPKGFREFKRCSECDSPLIAVPVLGCSDCCAELPLRAFAYRRHGAYRAECIDLSLLTQADTEEDAIKKLQEQMYGYLKVAFEGNPKGLVLRPSPITHRLRYHLHYLRRWCIKRCKKQRLTWHPDGMPHPRISHC